MQIKVIKAASGLPFLFPCDDTLLQNHPSDRGKIYYIKNSLKAPSPHPAFFQKIFQNPLDKPYTVCYTILTSYIIRCII
jgi:hypothetical protein